MWVIISVAFFFAYLLFFGICYYEAVLKGKAEWVLYYMLLFLPVYIVLQSVVFNGTESELLVRIIQYSKEVLLFSFLAAWVIRQPNIFTRKWRFTLLDWCILSFLLLALIYLVLPIGQSEFLSKAVYYKNMLLLGLVYFFGRNCEFDPPIWRIVFKILFSLSIIVFIVVLFEKVTDIHFHSHIGLAKYNLEIHKIEPAGHYDLTWTFEAQGATKRFGSIFSNPLEYAASMLMMLSAAIIFLILSPNNQMRIKYLGLVGMVLLCVVFAYSRAAFVSVFVMLGFMAVVLKLYRLIGIMILLAFLTGIYITFFAEKEVQHFVLDTITFRNTSSLTHLIEWAEAVESMVQNPMGIGLATSGNAGGVEADIKIGGENQFLVYGVQLGFLGLLFYVMMTLLAILRGWIAFRIGDSWAEKVVPFVASTTKVGLLLPLFTANAEIYLFVSFVVWWFVGYSEARLQLKSK